MQWEQEAYRPPGDRCLPEAFRKGQNTATEAGWWLILQGDGEHTKESAWKDSGKTRAGGEQVRVGLIEEGPCTKDHVICTVTQLLRKMEYTTKLIL